MLKLTRKFPDGTFHQDILVNAMRIQSAFQVTEKRRDGEHTFTRIFYGSEDYDDVVESLEDIYDRWFGVAR